MEEAVIKDDYMDGSKGDKKIPAGTKLFSIEVMTDIRPVRSIKGSLSHLLYCGLMSSQSGFSRFMLGAESGDDLRCFQDRDQDGNFDIVYTAVGALKSPRTVYVVQRGAKRLEKEVAYRKLPNNEKENAGQVWFEMSSPLLYFGKAVVLFLGKGDKKQVIGTFRIDKGGQKFPRTYVRGGVTMELLSIKNGKATFKLLNPAEIGHEYSIVKTVTVTYH